MEDFDYTALINATERKLIEKLAQAAGVNPELGSMPEPTAAPKEKRLLVEIDWNGNVVGILLNVIELVSLNDLAGFSMLRRIDCSDNKIESLEPLRNMDQLNYLTLNRNLINSLAPIVSLKSLRRLEMRGNRIENITPLAGIKTLTYLNCEGNKIAKIDALSSLTKMVGIDFGANLVSDIKVLKGMSNLTYANFRCNYIASLEPIRNLAKLEVIDFSTNKIVDVDPLSGLRNLRSANLSNNLITTLKPISKLQDLSLLGILNNPLDFPPMSIAEKGMDSIRFYFEEIKANGYSRWNEAKVVILGDGDAGKTTLFNLISGTTHPFETEPTIGVNLSIKGVTGKVTWHTDFNIKAYMWDFAGQEIQYHLHHFFLTGDALYVLVADNRRGKTRWDYWFLLIRSIVQRNNRSNKASVVVVMNRKLDVETHFDLEITKFTSNSMFNSILDISHVEINLKKEFNSNNWKALVDLIWEQLCKLPIVNMLIPSNWKRFREQLEELSKKKKYVTLDEFSDIGIKSGVFTGLTSMNNALNYFKDIGFVLHYRGLLENVIFLDIQWVLKKLYMVIEKSKSGTPGRITENELHELWGNDPKHIGSYYHLSNLLSCPDFGMCYKVGDSTNYIIPCLLPERPGSEVWDCIGCLNMRIDYPIMPEDLIGRLIVRLSPWITDQRRVWCDGVVIVYHGTEAFISRTFSQQTGGKCLRISIKANEGGTEGLLWTIHGVIEAIHKEQYKDKISFMPYIACDCESCARSAEPFHFAMSALQTFMQNGVYKTHCHYSAKTIDVGKLIGQMVRTTDSANNVNYFLENVDTFVGENHGAIHKLMQDHPRRMLSGNSEEPKQ